MAEAGAWAGAGVGAAWIASQVEMRSVDGRTGWTSPFACMHLLLSRVQKPADALLLCRPVASPARGYNPP